MDCATTSLATARFSQAPSLPWDCIRADPGRKQAWVTVQKAQESVENGRFADRQCGRHGNQVTP